MIAGGGAAEYLRTWTVKAENVLQVLRAALRELVPDATTLHIWLADVGIPAVTEEWQGYPIRPTEGDRFLLELIRAVVGSTDDDEGTKIVDRFTAWLAARSISYDVDEWVVNTG